MIGSIAGSAWGFVSEPLPRVLLVEDDPVGRAFLVEALEGLPVVLVAAADCAAALAASVGRQWSLALLDLNLPDGDGPGLLETLRESGEVGSAVALTADPEATLDAALRVAGFVALAHKPLSAAALRRLVGEHAGVTRTPAGTQAVAEPGPPPEGGRAVAAGPRDWDDEAALAAAGGRADIVDALRGLLRADLAGQCIAVCDAVEAGDEDTARAVLHRMRAACGFCGAVSLERAVATLDGALLDGSNAGAALREFEACCARLCDRGAAPPARAAAEGSTAG
jgi:CheY-like chemotaxis protein